jgi:hypothetical protein
MAEMKVNVKKSVHPTYPRMICDSMHAMDATMKGEKHHGHSLQSIKKYMGDHYEMGHNWEKRVNETVNKMLKKHQLAHAAGHMGSFRLSKSMAAKEEKRLKRKPRVMKAPMKKVAEPVHKKAAPKRKAAKMEGPAKKAKKAMPKKMVAKK